MGGEQFFKKRTEKLAFRLYKERGNTCGSDKEDWAKAEQMIRRSVSYRLFSFFRWLRKSFLTILILGVALSLLVTLAVGLRSGALTRERGALEALSGPMVEIDIARFDIAKKDLLSCPLPALRCQLYCKMLNYGEAPAYIKNVEFFLKDIESEEFSQLLLIPQDGQKQWVGFGLIEGTRQAFSWEAAVDILSAEVIMRAYLLDQDIHNKKAQFWAKKDREITDELKKQLQPFAIIAQVEYYATDDKEFKRPFYYSTLYKVDRQLKPSYYSCAKVKWLKVSNSGVVSRVR